MRTTMKNEHYSAMRDVSVKRRRRRLCAVRGRARGMMKVMREIIKRARFVARSVRGTYASVEAMSGVTRKTRGGVMSYARCCYARYARERAMMRIASTLRAYPLSPPPPLLHPPILSPDSMLILITTRAMLLRDGERARTARAYKSY